MHGPPAELADEPHMQWPMTSANAQQLAIQARAKRIESAALLGSTVIVLRL